MVQRFKYTILLFLPTRVEIYLFKTQHSVFNWFNRLTTINQCLQFQYGCLHWHKKWKRNWRRSVSLIQTVYEYIYWNCHPQFGDLQFSQMVVPFFMSMFPFGIDSIWFSFRVTSKLYWNRFVHRNLNAILYQN